MKSGRETGGSSPYRQGHERRFASENGPAGEKKERHAGSRRQDEDRKF